MKRISFGRESSNKYKTKMINSHMISRTCANIPGVVTVSNNMNCRPILRKNEYRLLLLPVCCVLLLITFIISVYISTITMTHDDETKKFEDAQQMIMMPMSLQHRNNYLMKRYYYSLMPTDRSGGSIREILLAHAFTYQQNRKLQQLLLLEQNILIDANNKDHDTQQQNNPLLLDEPIMIQYGGVCPYSYMPLQRFRTLEKEAMIEKMHLSHVLPIGCPSWMSSSSSSSSKSSKRPNLIHNNDNRRYMSLHNNNDVQQNEFLLDDKLYRYNDSELITSNWRQYIHEQRNLKLNEKNDGIQSSTTHRVNNNNEFKIVVHIRRGDVNPCRYPERYLPNDHYMRLIEKYWPTEMQLSSSNYTSSFQTELPSTGTMTEKTVRVIIYSESESYESFDVFYKYNYTVLLDTSDLGAIWNDIIDADVFIMSRSSFSHVPAILNMKGKIIFTPFWEQPLLEDWIVVPTELMNQTELQISQLRTDACQYQKYRWKSSGLMKYLEKNFDLIINPKPSTYKMLKIKQF